MKRRIRISLIELGRKQRVTAAAMLNVARQECTTAEAMYDASERMRKAAPRRRCRRAAAAVGTVSV
jgi:hypothetical protein